jgi:hypothetical protein
MILAIIRQVFREESLSCTWVFEWKSPNSLRLKGTRQVEVKIKSILIIFFNINRIVHKEFILAGQLVSFTYCCDVLCEDFAPNFSDKCTDCCFTTTHRLTLSFSPKNFRPKTT